MVDLKSKTLCLLLAAFAALSGAAPARAAQVTFSASLDLSAPGVFNPYGGYRQASFAGWSLISAPVTMGVGDGFTLNYRFASGQALHAATLDYLTIAVWDWDPATDKTASGLPYSNWTTTGTMSLLGADGKPIYNFSSANSSSCCASVGGHQMSTLKDVTFYGVSYQGVVDELDQTRPFNVPAFGFLATGYAIVAPPVPEASTWAMLILGFCGLGWLARRRNRAVESGIARSSAIRGA